MTDLYQIQRFSLRVPGQTIAYSIFTRNLEKKRNLLMLHGAGVGGELTWNLIIRRLEHWSSILVPDLRGTGKTRHPSRQEHSFTAEQLLQDLRLLLEQHGWNEFDVAGYSFGGMLAMLLKQIFGKQINQAYLLEPALLDRRSITEVGALREHFSEIAQGVRHSQPGHGLEDQIAKFLDLVSPHRQKTGRAAEMSIQRLAHRPVGLANALDCVTRTLQQLDRAALLEAQGHTTSFYGGHSHPALRAFHQNLAVHQPDWVAHEIPGTDHSLPFQKPARIASLINERAASLDRG